ncbi:MAG: hypothetical protein H6597_00320 [Flavobacteriales bacterium]|nr:hypothetical protein [Flavobacteriales bacterium]
MTPVSTSIDMGGPYQDGMAGTVVTETSALDQTSKYRLVVNDDGGNGITDGGYVLTTPTAASSMPTACSAPPAV